MKSMYGTCRRNWSVGRRQRSTCEKRSLGHRRMRSRDSDFVAARSSARKRNTAETSEGTTAVVKSSGVRNLRRGMSASEKECDLRNVRVSMMWSTSLGRGRSSGLVFGSIMVKARRYRRFSRYLVRNFM